MTDDRTAGPPRARLHAVEDEPEVPDQVPRLLRFREQHPEVSITLDGLWRAVIPGQNGETVVCRYELRHVLDKLDELFAP